MNLHYFTLFQSLQYVKVNPDLLIVISGFGRQLFGVSFIFILKFFGKLLLLFLASAVISKILKLDKVSEDLNPHENARLH